ncbi:YflT domain-containing protein [Alkalihalophilus marmarensis]|uniref:general stress protein n=1 Tax=Alkalihalophilus marmarensis TaxID=521377 RepID=UPI002DBCAD10|nr:general stress protein [Alkalihalophilus marmarensis]MEC2072892.1 general stress protein [Alkalihalophilus marmarensis]
MKPNYKEFQNDEEVVREIETLKARGVDPATMYVITHDDDRTDRIADNSDANTVGASEVGLGTSIKNVFRKKGDELRAKFSELGFTEAEAENLENKLDQGKVILVLKEDHPVNM